MMQFRQAWSHFFTDRYKSESQMPASAIRRPGNTGLVFFFPEGAELQLIVCSGLVQIDISKISWKKSVANSRPDG